MHSLKLLICLLIFSFLIHDCKKDDEDSGINPVALSKTTNLAVSDVGDLGNGTDLQVSFSKIADEGNLSAYRIFVVNNSESGGFSLETASTVPPDNYSTVNKTGNNFILTLSQNAKTTSGEPIVNDKPYKVFIMSVANDQAVNINALSAASDEITLTDSAEGPPAIEQISNLTVNDSGDAGNGSDLNISFSRVTDESNVLEYRIFVVNSNESADFDLESAEAVVSSNYFKVDKTGNDFSNNLAVDSKTITGALISNDQAYQIFVMTFADNQTANSNSLSNPSNEITLSAEEKVTVTYIANDGVMIEYEGKKVVIDGINRSNNLSGWISPSNAEYMQVENGIAPFDDIDVIMITHNHGDHYSTTAVQNYLSAHPNTKLIVPSGMESTFSAFSSQIPDFTVDKFERINLAINGISIDVLHIEHFDQFGNDFSMVESFAYLIDFGGKKFLHTGDIDYIDSQLDVFNLLDDNVHVAFIPTFGDLVSITNSNALIQNVNPDHIICLHFLSSTLNTTLNQISNIYPDAETFTIPFETLEY